MASAKPFIQVACVCEKVLLEPDGVPSLIRIVDTYTMDLPKQVPEGFGLLTQLTAFVSLKSGDVTGRFELGLKLTQPDGKSRVVGTWPVEFKGNEHGVNLRIQFAIENPTAGLYWFDVLWGDDPLTRIPFRLKSREKEDSSVEAAASEPNLS